MLLKYSFAFFRHGSLWTYRLATWAVLIAGALFVALVMALRYILLPNIDAYREPIARAIGEAAGQRITIGAISGNWRGYRPELQFRDVQVFDPSGQLALSLDRVETEIGWLPLIAGRVSFDSLEIYHPRLEVRRDPTGALWVGGMALGRQPSGGGGFAGWVLAQRQVLIRKAGIVWRDQARGVPDLVLEDVNLRIDRDGAINRFGLTGLPQSDLASEITVRGEFQRGSQRSAVAQGRLYAEFAYANLALAQSWIELPLQISRGVGALRIWIDIADNQLVSATADVKLVNVETRLASDLPPLALAGVQGRLGWKRRGALTEVSAESFGFTTADGLQLAPMRFSYSWQDVAGEMPRSTLHLERLNLAPAVELAEFLPFDAGLRNRLARIDPHGMIESADFTWEGAWDRTRPYRAAVTFDRLSLRPDGALPGFRGVGGTVEANERGGTLSLNGRDAGFELPRVFSGALPLDYMAAEVGWTLRDDHVDITLNSVTFTNAHLAGSVVGSYRSARDGPGEIDLTGTLVRADLREVWRYIPARLPVTQAWLRRALLAGESSNARLHLKGPLKDFPFAGEKTGIFEVKSRAIGVTLDYADGWPPVTDIVGDFLMRGRRLEIQAQSGAILGVRLADVRAAIAELGVEGEPLRIVGSGEGQTADFLRFVAESPVSRKISGITSGMVANGQARLAIELTLPLRKMAESSVAGELVLADNQVTLGPRLPRLDGFGARIAFTERKLAIRDGRAQIYGSPVSFSSAERTDAALALDLSGRLDIAKLRAELDLPVLRYLDGSVAWQGGFALRDKAATLVIESMLAGLGSSLPAPFAKQPGAELPLRVELREPQGRARQLAVEIGGVASAQLLLDPAAAGGLKRGTVNLGAGATLPAAIPPTAQLPPGDGLWLRGSLDALDLDAWRTVWTTVAADRDAARPGFELAGVDLRLGTVDAGSRRFRDIRLDATRQNGSWVAALSGGDIAGRLSWTADGDGSLVARLSKLILPRAATAISAQLPQASIERLPTIDLVADRFVFEGKEMGRLAVVAEPQPSGWRLQRLEITNPDSTLDMNGFWNRAETSRTDMIVRLQVKDIGRFFARFGWPDGVRGGTALLNGPVAWNGGPTRLDIPSLSGRLSLQAENGRFRQIEPGAAKLLGILSLQALPRRMTLDFQDVFSKGFTFDDISTDLEIASGVATAKDFSMQGSSASVKMNGQVDLAAETQNLKVRISPALSESVALAGAIVNPAIGVAAYIAQKALKDPLGQIASFEYAITGTWTEPVVTRLGTPANETGRSR